LLRRKNALLPVIILTGDISASTRNLIAGEGLTQMNKPVSAEELEGQTQAMLRMQGGAAENLLQVQSPSQSLMGPQVIIVDDDLNFCETLTLLLQGEGIATSSFPSGEAFLGKLNTLDFQSREVCVLIDAYLGGMSGFDVLAELQKSGSRARAIMITGNGDVRMAVRAMRAGALDFIEKPIELSSLKGAIDRAISAGNEKHTYQEVNTDALRRLEKLTPREREVLERILTGQPNKNIAADLGISQRTVESHRASIMVKSECKSLPALVRLAFMAS